MTGITQIRLYSLVAASVQMMTKVEMLLSTFFFVFWILSLLQERVLGACWIPASPNIDTLLSLAWPFDRRAVGNRLCCRTRLSPYLKLTKVFRGGFRCLQRGIRSKKHARLSWPTRFSNISTYIAGVSSVVTYLPYKRDTLGEQDCKISLKLFWTIWSGHLRRC